MNQIEITYLKIKYIIQIYPRLRQLSVFHRRKQKEKCHAEIMEDLC